MRGMRVMMRGELMVVPVLRHWIPRDSLVFIIFVHFRSILVLFSFILVHSRSILGHTRTLLGI